MFPLYQKKFLTIFWDVKGFILEHYPGKGQTVNCATHSAIPKDKLKRAIPNKRRELLSKIVPFHYDNARLNVTTAKFETSSFTFCHIHLTVLTPHHATFMPSVNLERHHVVAALAMMKTLKKRCVSGLGNNRSPSSPMNQEVCGPLQIVPGIAGRVRRKILHLVGKSKGKGVP